MPVNPNTGRYESPRYQLTTSKGQAGGYPAIDADGDVLNGRGEKLLPGGGGPDVVDNGDSLDITDGGSGTVVDNGDSLTIN